MIRYIALMLLALALLLVGCAKGKDGEGGSVYGYMSWSSDINAVDLTQVGVTDSTIYSNTRYKLKAGNATIYWRSNSTVYYLAVTVEDGTSGSKGKESSLPLVGKGEDGKDGQDRVYKVYFSGSVLTILDDYLTDIGKASIEGIHSVPNLEELAPEGGAALPGVAGTPE